MKLIKKLLLGLIMISLIPVTGICETKKIKIAMIISARDSIVFARAIREILKRPDIRNLCLFKVFTERDILSNLVGKEDINSVDVIMADFMKQEFDDFLSFTLESKEINVYSLRCGTLATKLKQFGILPDLSGEIYYQTPTVGNLKDLILMILSRIGIKTTSDKPYVLPYVGIFHPDSDTLFHGFDDDLSWYQQRGKYKQKGFWIGIHTFRTSAIRENGHLEASIIKALEEKGINVLPIFGKPPYHKSLETYFLDENGNSRVHGICGFTFRFLRGFPLKTTDILTRINAPVFIPLEAHGLTIDQWEKSAAGISTLRTAWQVCIPEQNGGIEPTLVGGKKAVRLKGTTHILYDRVAIPEQVEFLIKRMQAWHHLKVTPTHQKKIALLYWNHPPGKQNIGGSYMNCFRSIAKIAAALKEQGYDKIGRAHV